MTDSALYVCVWNPFSHSKFGWDLSRPPGGCATVHLLQQGGPNYKREKWINAAEEKRQRIIHTWAIVRTELQILVLCLRWRTDGITFHTASRRISKARLYCITIYSWKKYRSSVSETIFSSHEPQQECHLAIVVTSTVYPYLHLQNTVC